MSANFSSRFPIEKLRVENEIRQSHYANICDEYDMYRLVTRTDNAQQAALNYSFLEHIVRISTTDEDEENWLKKLDSKTAKEMKRMIKEKKNVSSQSAMRELEQLDLDVSQFDTKTCVFAKIFDGTDGEISIEHIGPDEIGNWPVFNVMTYRDKAIILYTPQMTFLDGYDKFTSEMRNPIIPDSLIRGTRSSLVRPQFTGMKVIHKDVYVEKVRETPLEREISESGTKHHKDQSAGPVKSERKRSKSRKKRKRRSRKVKEPHDESENFELSDRFYPDTQSAAYHELEFSRAMQDAEEWREYDRKLAKRKSTREQCAIAEDCSLL